jgi:hypothetical protein
MQVVGAGSEGHPIQRASRTSRDAVADRAVVGVTVFEAQGPIVAKQIFGADADIPAIARGAGAECQRAVAVAEEVVRRRKPGPGDAAGDIDQQAIEGKAAPQPQARLGAISAGGVEVVGEECWETVRRRCLHG